MIEPVREALTTSSSPACRAKKAMISSAMLPKVALRMPPTCGPVRAPRRSVERPTIQASPRIATRRDDEQERRVGADDPGEDDRDDRDARPSRARARARSATGRRGSGRRASGGHVTRRS